MPATSMSLESLAPAIAEIWLVFAICAVLLTEVFAGERRRGLTPTLTLLALALGAALTVQYGEVGSRQLLFSGLYVADQLGWALKLAGFLVVAVLIATLGARPRERDSAIGAIRSLPAIATAS